MGRKVYLVVRYMIEILYLSIHGKQGIMGSRGLVPLQGGLRGARSVLERQRSGSAPSLCLFLTIRGG